VIKIEEIRFVIAEGLNPFAVYGKRGLLGGKYWERVETIPVHKRSRSGLRDVGED